MPDCLVIVERGGYQTADLATGEFRDATKKAFQLNNKHYPAELEVLCSKNNITKKRFHADTEVAMG